WPGFRGLLLLQLGTSFVFLAAVNLLPIYLQDMQRPGWLSAELASGLSITLTAITAALGMPFFGPWTDRHGPRGLLMLSLVALGGIPALYLVIGAMMIGLAPMASMRSATVKFPQPIRKPLNQNL